jgi:hypothetical protein
MTARAQMITGATFHRRRGPFGAAQEMKALFPAL